MTSSSAPIPEPPDDASGPEPMARRRFLSHMAWAGAAVVFTSAGGVLTACSSSAKASAPTPAPAPAAPAAPTSNLTFAQISDTHIGFTGAANPDVVATTTAAIAQINALDPQPSFVVHTGDLSHTATPEQFAQVRDMMSTLKAKVFYLPGEHDSVDDDGEKYRAVFGAGSQGDGWYSFDTNGVHFVSLVNTLHLDKLGHLGQQQLDFLKADLAPLSSETPLVIFSHIPLFEMYEKWGWATDDAKTALGFTKRFGSVTAINGHVHQLMTKVEGNVTFYAALGTAYPLPAPGSTDAASAQPLTVPAGQLQSMLGTRTVNYVNGNKKLAIADRRLA
jgi:3',5'-cyclic-AMP phosphodiesterase